MQRKRWIVHPRVGEASARLAAELAVSPALASLLIDRGYGDAADARAFLNPSLSQLHDPFLMKDMERAVERIHRALARGEKILIYGDYDVDGTTGTVVLRRALKILGATTGFHIPHRFTEGYGIQQAALEKAFEDGYTLILSVDCGIRAHEPLIWARNVGLDVIITDHHLPDDEEGAPPAYAVLNPNQAGCSYPDKNLAGVGVAFKLIQALFEKHGKTRLISGFLKMVAIGTVADVANLRGENRTIVSLGLADLPKASNPGLRALMEVAGCAGNGNLSSTDLGFRLGPRINAAGRMDAARVVVELFEAETLAEALPLAQTLDERNRERQLVQKQIVELAIQELRLDENGACADNVAVVCGDGWHRGVIGIAASKIAERIYRPCVVISFEDEIGHGSARSIPGYHLLNGLTSCAHLFDKFGGHSHAAGLTIRRPRLKEFVDALNAHASDCLSDEDLKPSIEVDLELDANEISPELLREMAQLEPFGPGNPRPVFVSRGLSLADNPRVLKEKHLKFHIWTGQGRRHEAIWWDGVHALGERTLTQGTGIELAYTLEPNTWRGEVRLQLCVQDLVVI